MRTRFPLVLGLVCFLACSAVSVRADTPEQVDLMAKDAAVLPAREALEMATIRAARAIHRDRDLGSLEAGKLADLIVVRLDGAHQTPLYNVYSQLVYATKFSDVETVVINGKRVMDKRRVLTVDEPAVLAKAREYAKQVGQSLRQP
jgi:5-methylthioadenosine/S-adenosylhomocysteine deaminase